ncbi:thermonuclease family protein [Rhodobacteraceae bacterium M382]|nr:thermonuclease family protein [Rhodobacteraceae bacterium M382]
MGSFAIITCLSLMAVDGDTVKCDGQNLRPMGDGAPHVSGFDTPELSRYSDCPEETHFGLLAAVRMSELLQTKGLIIEDSGEVDVFDRPLVVLRLPDGSTIGQRLIDEGLARVWTPGYRANWCE